jgi:hypothetical protein
MMGLVFVFGTFAAVQFMQGLFDRGDVRRAMGLVHAFRGPNGRGLSEQLAHRHAGDVTGDIVWRSEIESGFYGIVRATATVPLKGGSNAAYRWDVDLLKGGIHAADDAARGVIREMQGGNSPPPAPVPPSSDQESQP